MDSTLVPARDHRLAAPSKNYRYSTTCRTPSTPTRLVVAIGDPQPGNRDDCTIYRDSGIDRQLTADHLKTTHRRVRDRVEHPGRQEALEVLRDYRRATHTLAATATGIAFLRNLTTTD